MSKKLIELDNINWAQLEGGDVDLWQIPNWIRNLLVESVEVRKNALMNLEVALREYDENHEVTLYALAFLLELLQTSELRDKHEIIHFIGSMLTFKAFSNSLDLEIARQVFDHIDIFEGLLESNSIEEREATVGFMIVLIKFDLVSENEVATILTKLTSHLDVEKSVSVATAIIKHLGYMLIEFLKPEVLSIAKYLGSFEGQDEHQLRTTDNKVLADILITQLNKQAYISIHAGLEMLAASFLLCVNTPALPLSDMASYVPKLETRLYSGDVTTSSLIDDVAYLLTKIFDSLGEDTGVELFQIIMNSAKHIDFAHLFAGHLLRAFIDIPSRAFYENRILKENEIVYSEVSDAPIPIIDLHKRLFMIVIDNDVFWQVDNNFLAMFGLSSYREEAREFVMSR